MKRSTFRVFAGYGLTIIMAVFLVACSGGAIEVNYTEGAATPEEAFENVIAAAANGDAEAMAQMFGSPSMALAQQVATMEEMKEAGQIDDEQYSAAMDMARSEETLAQIQAQIDGEIAQSLDSIGQSLESYDFPLDFETSQLEIRPGFSEGQVTVELVYEVDGRSYAGSLTFFQGDNERYYYTGFYGFGTY